MPLPLIWAVGALAVGALKKGVDGGTALKDAKETQDRATASAKAADRKLELRLLAVREHGQTLEQQKIAIMSGVMADFVRLWERQKQRANISDKDFTLQLNMSPETLAEFKGFATSSLELASGVLKAGATGATVGAGVIGSVSMFGAAGTGAAISGLSGAAANSALLAWLGGGTLASGGGGMALGAVVAGGLFVAPAALVGSLILAKKGEEARTAAHKFAAEVDVHWEDVRRRCSALNGIEDRMDEVSMVLAELVRRLRQTIRQCETDERELDGRVKLPHFFAAASLAKTLSDVLTVPIIDQDVKASSASRITVRAAEQVMGQPAREPAPPQTTHLQPKHVDVPVRASQIRWSPQVTREWPCEGVTALVALDTTLIVAEGETINRLDYDGKPRQNALHGHTRSISDLSYGNSQDVLASAGDRDRTACVWNLRDGQAVQTLSWNDRYARVVAFSQGGYRLAVGYGGGTTKVYHVGTGNEHRSLQGPDSEPMALAYHPTEVLLAVAFADGTIQVYDTQSGDVVRSFTGLGYLNDVMFSPDGQYLATASDDRTARVYLTTDWSETQCFQWNRRYVQAIAFHPTLPVVATAFADGLVKAWHLPTGEELLAVGETGMGAQALAFTPDGNALIVSHQERITRYQLT